MSRPSRSNNSNNNNSLALINASTGTNSKPGSGGGGGPPSHPAEQLPEHRAFLMRSLERNDIDLAALMELNKSLDVVKMAILEHERGGELLLLDLGEGKIALDPDSEEDCLLHTAPEGGGGGVSSNGTGDACLPPELLDDQHLQRLCIEFLLRFKLRRKLLNRLSRRLNRVAHAMDGNDVAPPGPPRYGDLRLHVDPTEVQAYADLFTRQEQAIRAMTLQREEKQHDIIEKRFTSIDEQPSCQETESQGTVAATATPAATTTTTTGDAPMQEAAETDADASPQTETLINDSDIPNPDYDVLKSYDDAYEKRIADPSSGTFKYTMFTDRKMNQEEEDYAKIRYGAGIGATHRSMSAKEKETEFLRWQTSLLSRIPEQPTFADAGMDHCVFSLHERRHRALQKQQALLLKKKKEAEEENKRKIKEELEKKNMRDAGSDAEEMDDSEEEIDEATTDANMEEAGDKTIMTENTEKEDEECSKHEKEHDGDKSDGEDGLESKVDNSPSKKDNKDEDEQEEEACASKKIRPISLAAVPSFYEQDLKRIKLIHQELMAASMHEHARKKLEEVTKAYNTALSHSNELNSRRDQLEKSLQNLLYQSRSQWDDQKMKNVAAKDNWLMAKRQFESEELSKMLPSRWGKLPTGTMETQRYGRRTDATSQHVAHCLADIVDSVELITIGQLPKMRKYPYPCPKDNNAQLEALREMEAQMRKELSSVNAQFRQSEEERNRAWRKMLKTKAEFDLPHHNSLPMPGYQPPGAARNRVPLNLSNYHQVPLPNLRLSIVESVPQEVATARPVQASYIPQRSHVPASERPSSESRYSAARVKERIASDGTVAPVSEPKRSKDGLFLRPAGRTRKGMEWDAVRGIWVPAKNA